MEIRRSERDPRPRRRRARLRGTDGSNQAHSSGEPNVLRNPLGGILTPGGWCAYGRVSRLEQSFGRCHLPPGGADSPISAEPAVSPIEAPGALICARDYAAEPATLVRAARDFAAREPKF